MMRYLYRVAHTFSALSKKGMIFEWSVCREGTAADHE